MKIIWVCVCACLRACVCMHVYLSHDLFLSFFVCYWSGIHFYGCPHLKKKKKIIFFFGGGGGNGGSGVREGMLNSLFPSKSNLISAFILKLIDGYFWVNLQTLPSLHKFWVFSFPRVKKMEKNKRKKEKEKKRPEDSHLPVHPPADLYTHRPTHLSGNLLILKLSLQL